MALKSLHLHSMMVHTVIALAPMAAVAFVLRQGEPGSVVFATATWQFLTVFAVAAMLLISLPSALSGVFERGHRQVNWQSTHKLKLGLTFIFWALLVFELSWWGLFGFEDGLVSLPGLLVVIGNNVVVFLLSALGLKTTLGRQAWGNASYEPDLFKSEPVDILAAVAEWRQEEPKVLDLFTAVPSKRGTAADTADI